MRQLLYVPAVLVCLTSVAKADLIVSAGDWFLQPNLAGQEIWVSISGEGDVTRATVAAEVVGAAPLPSFTDGTMIVGTIFASNNTGSDLEAYSGSWAWQDMSTNDGNPVDGNGILAKLTVSTVGVFDGSFALKLSELPSLPDDKTSVGTEPVVNVTYRDGSITVVPEPSSIALLLMALGGVAFARKRR